MTIYAPGTNGNPFPKATLAGSSTMLSYPTGIDVDTQGRVYVANQYDNDIHVYAAGAVGDSPPIATRSGIISGRPRRSGTADLLIRVRDAEHPSARNHTSHANRAGGLESPSSPDVISTSSSSSAGA